MTDDGIRIKIRIDQLTQLRDECARRAAELSGEIHALKVGYPYEHTTPMQPDYYRAGWVEPDQSEEARRARSRIRLAGRT